MDLQLADEDLDQEMQRLQEQQAIARTVRFQAQDASSFTEN